MGRRVHFLAGSQLPPFCGRGVCPTYPGLVPHYPGSIPYLLKGPPMHYLALFSRYLLKIFINDLLLNILTLPLYELRSLIRLSKENPIRRQLKGSWRNPIRKAYINGISVEIAPNLESNWAPNCKERIIGSRRLY